MTSPGLVRIHRWVALGLGLFIIVMGLTGASMVFRDELTTWLTPAARVAAAAVTPGAYERILSAVRRLEPRARSLDIVPPMRADRAAEVVLHGNSSERYLFVDPHDGRVVADSEREWLPFATFFELHRRFLLGAAGDYVVGIAGTALAILAVTGLVMWWPRKLKQALRIRWNGNRLAVSYDLHRCVGAVFALFLLVNAVTGISMVFDEASVALVNRLSGSPPLAPLPTASSDALGSGRPLDEIVAAADRAFPGGVVSRIAIRDGNAPVVVRKRLPADQDTHGMNRIYVDAGSGQVLRVNALKDIPPGNAMFEWLYPLHTGRLVGTPYKLLLLAVGLAPLLSLVTGLIVWRSKAARRMAPVTKRAAVTSPPSSRVA